MYQIIKSICVVFESVVSIFAMVVSGAARDRVVGIAVELAERYRKVGESFLFVLIGVKGGDFDT